MSCDLESWFSALRAKLPTSVDDQIVLTTSVLPQPTAKLITDRLSLLRGIHEYDTGTFKAEVVHFHADRATYQHLGLLITAVVFHTHLSEVTIELTNSESEIKQLIVESPFRPPYDIRPGYNTRPYVFSYYPKPSSRIPWLGPIDPLHLPCFYLIDTAVHTASEREDHVDSLIVRGFGSDVGSMRFADFLLDIGQPSNSTEDFILEGDGGYRGVGYLSAEAQIWLLPSAANDPSEQSGPSVE